VAKLADADLLEEFISYQRWAGDDFSVHEIPTSYRKRAEKMALEILRRMHCRHAVGPVSTESNVGQACAKFFMLVMMEGPWQGDDVDGGSAQDTAEALGLIVQVPYDPEKHGESPYCEPGDAWYVPSDALKALLASEEQS
jgi:hypothetical protein